MSTNKKVKIEVKKIMRRRSEMSIYRLRVELQVILQCRIREDYLVANLLGVKGLMIDCESRSVWRMEGM